MTNAGSTRLVAVARVLAAVGGLFGVAGFTGYAFGVPALVKVRAGLQGMSPVTAFLLILLAAALLCLQGAPARASRWIAIVCAASACAVLGAHGAAGKDVISPFVSSLLFGGASVPAGRCSVATALSALMLSLSVIMRPRQSSIADLCGGAGLVISGTALLGYAYGIQELYALPMFNSMALHTAAGLFLLAIAALISKPEAGWAALIASDRIGGGATRRQLAFTLLPAVVGWLLLHATRANALGPGVAMALLVIATAVPLALLVLRDGRVLDALDEERRSRWKAAEHHNEELRERLNEQADELSRESEERTKAEAAMYRAQRMEAVGQLTGGIAHDFNNLLMAIRGNLELLQRRLPSADPKAIRYLESATAATDKGARLTGQLLAFSRSQRLDIRPVELDPVMRSARELIGTSLGPDIRVDLTLGSADAWVRTDETQLELAILNLAVNARDAMLEGGVVTISSSPCAERLAEEDDEGAYVSVKVADTGSGMTPDVVAKAVEPFFTTKERGKGTGLGLAQVYGFVRQCGGDLRITSEPGQGTTVEILLRCAPPVPKVADAPTAAANGEQAPAGKQPILVVDDDDAVRAVIVETLVTAGFEVVEASDGSTALSLLEEFSPSAAVIDFLMPGMNGAQVARAAQDRQPGLPIVFVSGYSDTVALDQITGAVVLRKPFDTDGLNRAVRSVLH